MLVKRDDRLSGLFDPYSDTDEEKSPWPEEDPHFDVSDESGSRPVPRAGDGANDAEANASGVPTPRFWDVQVPAGSTPLPVVTAKAEPTQRGLGVPPPPSAEEMAWFEQMPSLTSVAPLSVDAFDDETAKRPAPRNALALKAEPTENERITVRAPATGDTARARRRRAYAVALFALLGGVVAVLHRRRAAPNEHASATLPPSRALVAAPAEAPARTDDRPSNVAPTDETTSTDAAKRAPDAERGAPIPSPSSDRATADATRARQPTSRSARHEPRQREARRRNPNTEAALARSAAPEVASGLDAAPASSEPPPRRTLSLPPR